MTLPILLVGQAPGDPACPRLQGRSTQRFMHLLDLAPAAYQRLFHWCNLLDSFPGKAGKGDAFPLAAARVVVMTLPLAPVTLLLGCQVARAFSLPPVYFQWHAVRGCQVAVIPHPSGINHWWNTPAHRETFTRFMHALIPDTP